MNLCKRIKEKNIRQLAIVIAGKPNGTIAEFYPSHEWKDILIEILR